MPKVAFSETEKEILELIGDAGPTTFASLVEEMKPPSRTVLVQQLMDLKRTGYIRQIGVAGATGTLFELTDKGHRVLLNSFDEDLQGNFVSLEDLN